MEQPKIKEPKDLGIKILPKEEAKWVQIKEQLETQINTEETQLEINRHVLKFLEEKIKATQAKS